MGAVVQVTFDPPSRLVTGGHDPHPEAASSEAPGQLEAALAAQVDVQQGDIRSQLPGPLEGLGAVGGHAHDRDALALQEAAGGVQEAEAVVDDQAAQQGSGSQLGMPGRIPASWKLIRLASRSAASGSVL
jgi:hypothetical protein